MSTHNKMIQCTVFTASMLGAQHKKDSVKNKLASSLFVSLGKALNKIPPSLCGKQVVKRCSLLFAVDQYYETLKTDHNVIPKMKINLHF